MTHPQEKAINFMKCTRIFGSTLAVCVIGIMIFAEKATATLAFDANLTHGVYYGSGNINGGFTIDTENGVELGLRAKTRTEGSRNDLELLGGEGREVVLEDDALDVDLFFDYQKGKLGLYELMDVKEAAAQILGRPADIMTRDSLHRTLRQNIEASALQVF